MLYTHNAHYDAEIILYSASRQSTKIRTEALTHSIYETRNWAKKKLLLYLYLMHIEHCTLYPFSTRYDTVAFSFTFTFPICLFFSLFYSITYISFLLRILPATWLLFDVEGKEDEKITRCTFSNIFSSLHPNDTNFMCMWECDEDVIANFRKYLMNGIFLLCACKKNWRGESWIDRKR